MASASCCSRCGSTLAEDGLCPRCVFQWAIDPGPTAPTTPGDARVEDVVESRPDSIGTYKILDVLGRGGMGIVYLAEQREPVRRRVAIKLIKLGMDTQEVVARFETERQALAMMNHPNVARVLDAGATKQGRPYFVMEYVAGEPINRYCDQARLDTRERLALFTQVCHGVQHAHQKGVIHRDIKPSNVLVEMIDDRPVPKIIDFGVAKATHQQLTEKTLFTRHGQLVGTPEYMSPEQAHGTALDIDTRTDVYALGVLLYELLVGTVPLERTDLRRAAYDELCRRIREVEPAKPSTRIHTLGDASNEIAKSRRCDPSSLSRQLRGDLDWITMKALEKERTRRYGSPEALAEDIQRFLRDEPITAGPPSGSYRFKKFVRRHTWGVAAAAIVALALLTTVTLTSYGLVRALRAEAEARRSAATATEVVRFLTELFKVSDPEVAKGDSITVREVLDRGRRNIEHSLEHEPQTRAHLMTVMGEVYSNLGLYEPAEELLLESVRSRASLLGQDDPRTLSSAAALAEVYRFTGDLSRAERTHRETLERRRRVLGEHHLDTASSMNDLGVILMLLGKDEEGEELFEQALAVARASSDDQDQRVVATLSNLGWVYRNKGRFGDAEQMHREAWTIARRDLGPRHPQTLTILHNVGYAVWRQSRFEEAEQIFLELLEARRQVLGETHQETIGALNMLAGVYFMQGRHEEAAKYYQQTVDLSRSELGDDHPATLRAWNNLGMVAQRAQRYELAKELFGKALEGRRRVLGAEHPETLSAANNYASVLTDLGDYGEAERLHRENLQASRRVLGDENPSTLWCADNLARVLASMGRLEESIRLHEEVLATRRRTLGDDHYDSIASMGLLAREYGRHGAVDKSLALFGEALERASRVLGADHPDTVALRGDYDALATRARRGR